MRRDSGRGGTIRMTLVAACAAGLLSVSLAACGTASDGNATNDANDAVGQSQDWSASIAATVNGHDIMESEVNDYIDGYRKAYGLVTDAQWATFLDEQDGTASAYREAAIRQIAERYVVGSIADDEGISVTDDEVDAAIANAREQAGYAGDDDGWDAFLSSIGKDKDSYRADVRSTLLVRKYVTSHARIETPSDAQMRSYASTNVSKYTGKRVVSVSFDRVSDANAAKASLGGDGIGMDAVSAAADAHNGTVTSLGWTGITDIDSACATAIAELSAGQASDVVSDGGRYCVFYVAQEFDAGSDGSIDVGAMPQDLYDTLKADVTSSVNAGAMQSCLDALLDGHGLSITDMPSGLPYDIDIKANSTYSASNDTNAENADTDNASDASNASSSDGTDVWE